MKLAASAEQRMRANRHNRVTLHLTPGDLATIEAALPEQIHRRSAAQHIIARLIGEARPQLPPTPAPAARPKPCERCKHAFHLHDAPTFVLGPRPCCKRGCTCADYTAAPC